MYDAPLHTKKHSTSWRFDLVSPWRLDHPRGSRQDTHGTLGPLRRKAVGGSTALHGDTTQGCQSTVVSAQDSKIFQDPDSPSSFGSAHVSHQAFIPLSCKKPSRDSRMQRNTREDMSIPGSVFDCQLARRVPGELHNNSRNLATSSGI